MKIKYIFTLFSVLLASSMFTLACADNEEVDSYQSNLDYQSNSNYQSNLDYHSNVDYQSNSNYHSNLDYQSNSNYQSNLDYHSNVDYQSNSNYLSNCAVGKGGFDCFISVWNTESISNMNGFKSSDASATNTIVLPIVEGGTYNFYVDWGDETEVQSITNYSDETRTHEYDAPGEYTIHIAGEIKGWSFLFEELNENDVLAKSAGDAVKLLEIKQWGPLSFGNTAGGQFYGAEYFNLTATDTPDLSDTSNLRYAFHSNSNFNGKIGDWNVENVTDMEYMFYNATSFNNGGVALNWGDKTSKVTDMTRMFYNAEAFNQDIGGWDVTEVTSMENMFFGARAFNQDIGDWEVTKVTTMENMFFGAVAFNNDDEALDWGEHTDAVTNMGNMFNAATAFDSDISSWKVSEVTTMSNMFIKAKAFNQDISDWDVSAVTTMEGMFKQASNYNQPLNNWSTKTGNVINMAEMFNTTDVFNQDISDWDVSKVTTMQKMFYFNAAFNNGATVDNAVVALDWDEKTAAVTDMENMFNNATSFNQDISGWNVSKVTSSDNFAAGATTFEAAHNPIYLRDNPPTP